MRRRRYLALAAASVTSLTGCLGRVTENDSPVRPSGVSVEYVVRPGSIPDDVAHLYVDFAAYLAERSDDVYSCTPGAPLMDNEYDPTPTPLPEPEGACEGFDAGRVDVAALDGPRRLGPFEADGRFTGGHTLVAPDPTLVIADGTTATDVYDTDFRAITERTAPSGAYGVEIGVTDYAGTDESPRWRYGIDVERFEATPAD